MFPDDFSTRKLGNAYQRVEILKNVTALNPTLLK